MDRIGFRNFNFAEPGIYELEGEGKGDARASPGRVHGNDSLVPMTPEDAAGARR